MSTTTAGEKIPRSKESVGTAWSQSDMVGRAKLALLEVAAEEISKMRLRMAMTKSMMPSWKRSTMSAVAKSANARLHATQSI